MCVYVFWGTWGETEERGVPSRQAQCSFIQQQCEGKFMQGCSTTLNRHNKAGRQLFRILNNYGFKTLWKWLKEFFSLVKDFAERRKSYRLVWEGTVSHVINSRIVIKKATLLYHALFAKQTGKQNHASGMLKISNAINIIMSIFKITN